MLKDDLLPDTSDSTYEYYGFCNAGNINLTDQPIWKIMRVTKGTDVIEWAGGNTNYDKVWDDKASLLYSSDLNL